MLNLQYKLYYSSTHDITIHHGLTVDDKLANQSARFALIYVVSKFCLVEGRKSVEKFKIAREKILRGSDKTRRKTKHQNKQLSRDKEREKYIIINKNRVEFGIYSEVYTLLI